MPPKCLTNDEFQSRKEKGPFFRFDEKFEWDIGARVRNFELFLFKTSKKMNFSKNKEEDTRETNE